MPVPIYHDDASYQDYSNPYYVGPNSGEYSRFNWKEAGSGVQNLEHPSFGFDEMILSQFTQPLDLAQYGGSDFINNIDSSGIGGQFRDQLVGDNQDLQAAIEFNERLQLNKKRYKDFFDHETIAHFKQQGVDISQINSAEDLYAIDPQLKGKITQDVTDASQRELQRQNQLPPQGIMSSLPGKIIGGGLLSLATGGVGGFLGLGSIGTAALTGGVHSLATGGGLIDALKTAGLAGLTQYGFGKLTENLTNPFTGKPFPRNTPFNPSFGGDSGNTYYPTGDFTPGGREIFGQNLTPNPITTFPRIDLPDDGGIGRGPYPSNDLPTTGGIAIPLPDVFPGPQPSPNDNPPREENPIIPPIISGPAPSATSGPGLPGLPAPSGNTIVSGGGGQQSFSPFTPGQIPGPPDPLRYFQYGHNPFLRG